MRRRRIEYALACALALLLLADLVVLALLRPIVESEGIPKDEDDAGGTVSTAAEAYGAVVTYGLLWVPLCTVIFAILCARLTRDHAGELSIVGHLWIIGSMLYLVVMFWAGSLWLGFGW
jgi:hypothetical protein